MRVILVKKLREFWTQHASVEMSLETWYHDVKSAEWQNSMDVKASYSSASFVSDNRVVFNIKGNKYRLVAAIKYDFSIVYIRFIGTHSEYDKIDVTTI